MLDQAITQSGGIPPTNSSKHLSQAQKDAIREYLTQASGEDDRKRRKEEMMREHNLTEGVVNALEAWVKIRADRQSRSTKTTEVVPPMVSDTISSEGVGIGPKSRVYTGKPFDIINPVGKARLVATFRDILRTEPEFIFDQIEIEAETYSVSMDAMELFVKQNVQGAHSAIERERTKLSEADERKDFTEVEKESIRAYVNEGGTESEKKSRRRELAHKYGVSVQKIGAITAWSTIRENRAGNSSDRLSATGETAMEEDGATDLEISHPSLDIEFIRELSEEYDLSDHEGREAFLAYVYDCFEGAKLEDIRKIVPSLSVTSGQEDVEAHARSGEGMGALVNYDNVAKNTWRQKLKEFIDENTDPAKRGDMKVLCLPGVECLEIPLYLELGFRPENIVGVEAGIVGGKKYPAVIARFQENATKYSIQTRIGKLEKVLETEETIFNVVSLDFLGPWSLTAGDILSDLKLSEDSLVLTNFQGRRESSRSQLGMNLHQAIKAAEIRSVVSALDGNLDDFLGSQDFSETRDDVGLTRIISDHAGVCLLDSGPFSKKFPVIHSEAFRKYVWSIVERSSIKSERQRVRILSDERKFFDLVARMLFLGAMGQFTDLFVKTYPSLVPKKRDQVDTSIRTIIIFLSKMLVSRRVTGHQKFRYSGNANTPMCSDFLRIKTLKMEDFSGCARLTGFLVEYLNGVMDMHVGKPTELWIEKSRRPTHLLDSMDLGDKICLQRQGKPRMEMTLAKLWELRDVGKANIYDQIEKGDRNLIT